MTDHAPGHYRAFGDYIRAYAAEFGAADDAATYGPQYDSLIDTSYMIVGNAQCDETGLVPNW